MAQVGSTQVNSAIDPATSATVSASAGTGKTWSLVSRIIRLLINDADPGSILAITFTRKAAAEMQSRLNERLLELASCEPNKLIQHLKIIGAPTNETTIQSARGLYEKILYTPHPPRITTFHSMCQDLLKRFPFDANVPPGFELTEQTSELENEARDLLVTEATIENNGPIARALEVLFNYCGSLESTLLSLDNFLKHRSDWWAFTLNQKNPVEYAREKLKTQLKLVNTEDPALSFFTPEIVNKIGEFVELLAKHPTSTNMKVHESILELLKLNEDKQFSPAFDKLIKVFFTDKLEPRKRKSSNAQIKKMGESGDGRFIELHHHFVELIDAILDSRAKINTFHVSCAWYLAGNQLLRHYQTIKNEQRVLDFADLEWSAYLLLIEENHASWVQYKLDARVNHVLIDEYQDTNPTQWHLLKPLLEEISSSNENNSRSVFLVGDTKQSIYRFRRAQPKLFDIAQNWMQQHLETVNSSLDMSRRSAPAIIDFINTVFAEGPLKEQIVHFEPHSTHLTDLWGKVTVVSLFEDEDAIDESVAEDHAEQTTLRNPLIEPLVIQEDQRRVYEAEFIAGEITRLVSEPTVIGEKDDSRHIRYSDIIILLGQRTHAAIYEKALTAANIPYIGINKGTLLDTLEIKDVSALLNLLVTPFDDLALAQILKSPVFGCSDQDLISLASIKKQHWLDRLTVYAEQKPKLEHITRANNLLTNWKSAAGKLPVHDLLDKIFSDSNLINRYVAAYPPQLKHSVESNLNRFIELALEIDSGRYPSISRFLQRLDTLRANQQDAPDEMPAGKNQDRVRLLTIHAAKGLEAPVIFLADATNTSHPKEAYQAVVDWPADANNPEHFLLALRKDDRDRYVSDIFSSQSHDVQREQANLLYVAITRARQLLYITGSKSQKKTSGSWYDAIYSQIENHCAGINQEADGAITFSSNSMPETITVKHISEQTDSPAIDPGLSKPLTNLKAEVDVTPSYFNRHSTYVVSDTVATDTKVDFQLRGIVIHKILQLMTESSDSEEVKHKISSLYSTEADPLLLEQCWLEAESLITQPALEYLFNASKFDIAYNEVPLQFKYLNYNVNGVIDRLVVAGDSIFLVDYKTQLTSANMSSKDVTEAYGGQMSVYCHGVQQLWPDKSVETKVLFTHHQKIVGVKTTELADLLVDAN